MPRRLPQLMFGLVVLLVIGTAFTVDLYFDWLWFEEVGKTTVFTTSLYARSALGTATLLVVFAFLYFNLWFANRAPGRIQIGIPTPAGEFTAYTLSDSQIRRVVGAVSLAASVFFAFVVGQDWETVWKWLHQTSFGSSDAVFGRDVSFYVFTLPVMEDAVRLGLVLVALAAAGVLALGYLKGGVAGRGVRAFGRVGTTRRHIAFLAAAGFLLLAVDAYLDRFGILFSSGQGPMYGASYSDIHARAPLLLVLAAAAVVGAVQAVRNAFAGSNRNLLAGAALYALVLI